jgi:hypothetical protein
MTNHKDRKVRLRWKGGPRSARTFRVIWLNDIAAFVRRMEGTGRTDFEWSDLGSDRWKGVS